MIVSREGAFFLQTTATTKLGSAALIPYEDSLRVAAPSPDKGKTERGSVATLTMEGDHWRTLKVF